jgi:hypothetical protein
MRLLLVEFAAADRFHRAIAFPYVLGWARATGAEARWWRFGVKAAVQFVRGESGVGLEAGEVRQLLSQAREFSPDAVVFGSMPAAPLTRALREALPGARLALDQGSMLQPGPGDEPLAQVGARAADLAALLGADDAAGGVDRDQPLYRTVTPDFGFQPMNALAREMQPLPFVVLGEECTYNRPLASNPIYRGVDLTDCVRPGGCAFCPRPPNERVAPITPGQIEGQLTALRKTLPRHAGRLAVRLVGEPAMEHLEQIARLWRELGFAPSDLLLDARADGLLRLEGRVGAVAGTLENSGHCLHLALIGVESFAQAELDRLNKGTSTAANLDAALALLALEAAHPASFAFRQHGGLSTILFTPWSTLEDVLFNLRLVKMADLEGVCGKLLTSRLRLTPGLPITALARRDGLLVDAYQDPALDTAARNLYAAELPWRFADPRVEPVCRLLVRLAGDTPFDADDALMTRVKALQERGARQGLTALDLALEVAEEALSAGTGGSPPPPASPPGDALRGVDQAPRVGHGAAEAWTEREAPREAGVAEGLDSGARILAGGADPLALFVALSRLGVKPVSKIEPIRVADLPAWRANTDLPNLTPRVRLTGGGEACEVFFGLDRERVERAARLTDVLEQPPDSAAWADAAAQVGRLLGYPGCCSDGFAFRETARARESYALLHLARRVAVPGAVPWELNPWGGGVLAQYVPCSLECQAALSLARRSLEVAREVWGGPALEAMTMRMRHPWLVVLKGQGSALELVPEDQPGEAFRFRPGARLGHAVELELACRADELRLEGERLRLLRQGAEVADLSAVAHVWWHERALQGDLWRRVLTLRALQAAHGGTTGTPAPATGGGADGQAALERALRKALARLDGTGDAFAVDRLERSGEGRLLLTLRVGDELAALVVTRTRSEEKALFKVGPFAFSHPSDRPLNTFRQREAVRGFAQALAHALRKR